MSGTAKRRQPSDQRRSSNLQFLDGLESFIAKLAATHRVADRAEAHEHHCPGGRLGNCGIQIGYCDLVIVEWTRSVILRRRGDCECAESEGRQRLGVKAGVFNQSCVDQPQISEGQKSDLQATLLNWRKEGDTRVYGS